MKDLTTGSPARQLFFFAIPMILSTFLQSVYQIVDAIWVGQLLGPEPFAAVSVTFPVVFSLMSIFIGISVATNILVGQSFGAKNMEFLKKVTVNSYLVTMAISLVFTLIGVFLGKPLLVLMNTPAALLENAYAFMLWFSSGLVFLFLNNWMMGILRGLGDGKTPLYLTGLSVSINIALVPFLIMGIGPIPPLGVAGSALATVFANLITTGLGFLFLLKKNHLFNFLKWEYKIDWAIVKKIFGLGIPASLQMIIVSFSFVLLMSIVNLFGPDVIGAYGIGIRIDSLAFIPAFAISMAVSAMVAQNLGAGKKERVGATMKAAVTMATVFCLGLIAVLNIWPREIAGFFTQSPGIIAHTESYLRIVSVQYWIFSIFFLYMGAVRGAGEMTKPLIIIAVIMAIRVPLAWALGKFTPLQETGIWWSILITTLLGLVMIYIYYHKGGWKDRVVVHARHQNPPESSL